MNGNNRRRLEFSNPEKSLLCSELKERKNISNQLYFFSKNICLIFMVIGTFFIAFLSTRFEGIIGFLIAFLGIISVIIIGMLMAYNIGNKMSKLYQKSYIGLK